MHTHTHTHHPETKKNANHIRAFLSGGAHVLRLNIYEAERARRLCWMDVNVKTRKGALMCPSGSTFTVLTVPYVPKTEPSGSAELI